MKKVFTVATMVVAGALFAVAALRAQASPQTPVQVMPPAAVRDRASDPKPPATARQAKSVGKGKVSANTANSADDTDSLWVEKIDVDGDGNLDEASLLWDDEDKVLYLFKEGTFTCKNGGTGDGEMLIAVYGKGNTRHKPVGSGWYAVELDKSECAAQAAGVYGCKFDASGNATACGMVAVDDKNDDIVIATVSK